MKRSIAALLLAATVVTPFAQPVPKLTSISREYVQRGASTEITISGENLAEAKFLISGQPGIQLKVKNAPQTLAGVESAGGGISTVTRTESKKLVATVEIDATAPLGTREIRIASTAGVSNPMPLTVSHLPEYISDTAATSLDKAQQLSLPFAVTGTIGAAAEADFYAFTAKKGQKIVFEVVAQRIGSQLDSSLAVLDRNGRELARNEDAVGNDSVLEFTASEDGTFVAQVRDYRLQGGDAFKYRLLASPLPYITGTFPLGGRRGETVDVQLRGYNLNGLEKMTLKLDTNAAKGTQELRATTAEGPSNPFRFIVSDLPQFIEMEPNDARDKANTVSLPVTIEGRIEKAKDADFFKFHVEKDQRWVFDAAAQRFGSPLDALLTLMDSNGAVLQKNDDAGSPDARVDYTFGAAGDYVLKIEDLLEHGGADFVYRVTATQPMPNFEAKVINDTPRVPRGGRTPVRCEFARLNNFNEAVRITAEDLPPGLYAEPLILTPNDPEAGLLFLSARDDAQLGSVPLHLKATAVINGKLVTHSVSAFAGDRAAQSAYLTVVEAAPFMVYPGQLLATVEQDQTTTVEALVERSGGFLGEIKVSVEGFSAGREALTKSFDYQPVRIKANESHANISLKAKVDSETGARMIVLRGDATVNGQAVTAFSAPIPLAASEIPFVLATTMKRVTLTAVPPGSQSSAGEAVFGVKATRRAGFKGEITLKLEGVPDGITATVEKIAEGAGESSIKLGASDKAAAGKETQLVLTGAGVFRDKNYKFKPQPIALQINAPEAVEIKTAEVKTTETAANSAK